MLPLAWLLLCTGLACATASTAAPSAAPTAAPTATPTEAPSSSSSGMSTGGIIIVVVFALVIIWLCWRCHNRINKLREWWHNRKVSYQTVSMPPPPYNKT